jgi:hypothetical protein
MWQGVLFAFEKGDEDSLDFLLNHFSVFPHDHWKIQGTVFFDDISCGPAHGSFGSAGKLWNIRLGAFFRSFAFHKLVTDRTNSMSLAHVVFPAPLQPAMT